MMYKMTLLQNNHIAENTDNPRRRPELEALMYILRNTGKGTHHLQTK